MTYENDFFGMFKAHGQLFGKLIVKHCPAGATSDVMDEICKQITIKLDWYVSSMHTFCPKSIVSRAMLHVHGDLWYIYNKANVELTSTDQYMIFFDAWRLSAPTAKHRIMKEFIIGCMEELGGEYNG